MKEIHLIDDIDILDVGEVRTVGTQVTRDLNPALSHINGLVQTTSLPNATDGRVVLSYSIKVEAKTELKPGQAVRVNFCRAEPDLAGVVLLVDSVSLNGQATLRKGVAVQVLTVNQEGKGILS